MAARIRRNKRFSPFHFGLACAGLVILAACSPLPASSPAAGEQTSKASSVAASTDVFTRRILPILKSKNPSLCAECHLSGVDLKDYLRPSEGETFVSLRDQGMIDLKAPDQSRILRLIRMSAPKTPLLTRKARDAEYEAFRQWIVGASTNSKLLSLAKTAPAKRARPAAPDAVIRHSRMDALLASFSRNVLSQEGRCMNCHRSGTAENDANVKKYGARVAWFVPNDAEETMRRVIAQKLVNVSAPEQSLLLLKPLNKAPHGGGVKLLMGDTGYKLFLAWLQDYSKSVKGSYASEKDLPPPPKEALYYTESLLNVSKAPASWSNRLLRVDAYAWDAERSAWSAKPVATGDRQMGANGETNVLMFRIVAVGGEEEKAVMKDASLSPGRYLLKYYADKDGTLDRRPDMPTDAPAFYQGSQEISAPWGKGWGAMTRTTIALK